MHNAHIRLLLFFIEMNEALRASTRMASQEMSEKGRINDHEPIRNKKISSDLRNLTDLRK